MLESIETFGAENGVNAAALQSITRSWLSYLRAVQKNNAPPKAVRDDLMAMGVSSPLLFPSHIALRALRLLQSIDCLLLCVATDNDIAAQLCHC